MRKLQAYLILLLFVACTKEEDILPKPSLTEAEITGTWRLIDYSIRSEDYDGLVTSDHHRVTRTTGSTLLLTFSQFPFVYTGEGAFQTLSYHEGLPDTTRSENDLFWQSGNWASEAAPHISISEHRFTDLVRWEIESKQDSLVHLVRRDTVTNRTLGVHFVSTARTYRVALVKQ